MVNDRTKAGLATMMMQIAIAKAVSGYLGDGAQRWPAVHVLDAARLFGLAAQHAAPGTIWHGVTEEGVTFGALAEVIGQRLDLPVRSFDLKDAGEHFGPLAHDLWTRFARFQRHHAAEIGLARLPQARRTAATIWKTANSPIESHLSLI